MRRDSLLHPGGTVTYSIWVWSTVKSRQVTATVSRSGQFVDEPTFTLCPAHHRRTCSIGSLPAYQALELLVTDHIRKKATQGEPIGLTVVVQGDAQSQSGGALSPAEAAVSTVLSQTSSSAPAPPPFAGASIPGTDPGLPGTGVPGTSVTPPGNITSMFPVVTPTPTPSGVRHAKRNVTKAISTASSLPLDPRLIGGQLAGLAVLAAAITMAVARLSLRTPRLASTPESGSTPAAPPPAPEPSAAETSDTSEGTAAESKS